MKPEADAALIATRREEWIEGLPLDAETHATTIVGEENFDFFVPQCRYLDGYETARADVGKCVRDRIEEEIGQYLSVRPGIAIHLQIGLALDVERQVVLSQTRAQAFENLLGEVADVEDTLI